MYQIRFSVFPADHDLPREMQGYLYLTELFDPSSLSEVENVEMDEYITEIMGVFGIGSNNDWKVHEVTETTKNFPEGHIREINYPAIVKRSKAIQKAQRKAAMMLNFMENKLATYQVKKKHVKFNEKEGKITVYNPAIKESFEVDVDLVWNEFQKAESFGEETSLMNDFDEKIFEARDGGFLSMTAPDIKIIDPKKALDNPHSIFQPLKGGIYIRENGDLDFGNADRTKYMKLNLTALAKQSYKVGLSSGNITPKLLEDKSND